MFLAAEVPSVCCQLFKAASVCGCPAKSRQRSAATVSPQPVTADFRRARRPRQRSGGFLANRVRISFCSPAATRRSASTGPTSTRSRAGFAQRQGPLPPPSRLSSRLLLERRAGIARRCIPQGMDRKAQTESSDYSEHTGQLFFREDVRGIEDTMRLAMVKRVAPFHNRAGVPC